MFGTSDGLMEEILEQASERVVNLASPMFAKGMGSADVARSMNMTEEVIAQAFARTGASMPGATVQKAPESQGQGPTSAEARAAEAAERAKFREDIELLQNAIGRLRPSVATRATEPPAHDREPGVDRAQTKADLLAKLRPLLAADEEDRLKARLAKKAMRRLARGR